MMFELANAYNQSLENWI